MERRKGIKILIGIAALLLPKTNAQAQSDSNRVCEHQWQKGKIWALVMDDERGERLADNFHRTAVRLECCITCGLLRLPEIEIASLLLAR